MDDLLREIRSYCTARGIAESTFGTLAVNDGKFVARLAAGRSCLMSTVDKVRRYMADNPPDAGSAA